MAIDDPIIVEVYKFAASQLTLNLEEIARSKDGNCLGISFQGALSQRVINFLEESLENPAGYIQNERVHLERITANLNGTLNRTLKDITADGKGEELENEITGSRIRMMTDFKVGKYPFTTAATAYYAGERLASFMRDRIKDKTAVKYLNICESIKERIDSILSNFVGSYEDFMNRLAVDGMKILEQKYKKDSKSELMQYHEVITSTIDIYYSKSKALLKDLELGLTNMKSYVLEHQLAPKRNF